MVGMRLGRLSIVDHKSTEHQAGEIGLETESTGEPWEILEERYNQIGWSEALLGRGTGVGGPEAVKPGSGASHILKR